MSTNRSTGMKNLAKSFIRDLSNYETFQSPFLTPILIFSNIAWNKMSVDQFKWTCSYIFQLEARINNFCA